MGWGRDGKGEKGKEGRLWQWSTYTVYYISSIFLASDRPLCPPIYFVVRWSASSRVLRMNREYSRNVTQCSQRTRLSLHSVSHAYRPQHKTRDFFFRIIQLYSRRNFLFAIYNWRIVLVAIRIFRHENLVMHERCFPTFEPFWEKLRTLPNHCDVIV